SVSAGAILSAHVKSAIHNSLFLFLGSVLFNLAGTWSLPLIDRDEPRFAEASREMIQRADYVVPYFNNQLRLDKPPLAYWAHVPIAWLPLLTVGATIVLARDWELARHLKLLRGILLMLAVVALWGIPALVQTHGQFLAIGIGRHVISRSLATMEGHGASSLGMYLVLLPFYFVTILVSFFPWSIKLPWLFQQLWIQKKAGNADHGYS